jgi:hypothetical protein
MRMSRDEEERARLMSEYKYELDTQSKVVHARREGRKEGFQEGLQKGMQEGEQKKTVEFARKLKSRGVAAEQIAEDTGLSLQQIEGLSRGGQPGNSRFRRKIHHRKIHHGDARRNTEAAQKPEIKKRPCPGKAWPKGLR